MYCILICFCITYVLYLLIHILIIQFNFFQITAIANSNVSGQNMIHLFDTLDKDFDLPTPINQSSILRELDVLISNLKLKINGDINVFNATINVSIYYFIFLYLFVWFVY